MKGRERKTQPKHRKIVFYEDRHFFELTGNKFLWFRQTNIYARVSKPWGGGGVGALALPLFQKVAYFVKCRIKINVMHICMDYRTASSSF